MWESNQAIPAIVFLLILMTVAVWILGLCRDGTYHCEVKRGERNFCVLKYFLNPGVKIPGF